MARKYILFFDKVHLWISILERLLHMQSGGWVVKVCEYAVFLVKDSSVVCKGLIVIVVRPGMGFPLEIVVLCNTLPFIYYPFREYWARYRSQFLVGNDVMFSTSDRFHRRNSCCGIFPFVWVEDVPIVPMLGQHRIIDSLEGLLGRRGLKAE